MIFMPNIQVSHHRYRPTYSMRFTRSKIRYVSIVQLRIKIFRAHLLDADFYMLATQSASAIGGGE